MLGFKFVFTLVFCGLIPSFTMADFEELDVAPSKGTLVDEESGKSIEVQSTTTASELKVNRVPETEPEADEPAAPPSTRKEKIEKILQERQKILYPQKKLNQVMTKLCQQNPKHKEVLSNEQIEFYCLIQNEFRGCYSKDVLYNNDINRQQKITMAKDCIAESASQTNQFANNPLHSQNLQEIENFTETFLQVMLPEVKKAEEPVPTEPPAIYTMGIQERRDKSSNPLNNQNEEVRPLQYVDAALDDLNQEVLQMKTTPEAILKQYPQAITKELYLLQTLPEETNDLGQKIVYAFQKENCLTRPMSASDCSLLIKELQRRRQSEQRYKEPFFKEPEIFPNTDSSAQEK